MSWSNTTNQIKTEIRIIQKIIDETQIDLDYWNSHSVQENEKYFLLFSNSCKEMQYNVLKQGKDLEYEIQKWNRTIVDLKNRLKIHNSRKHVQIRDEMVVTFNSRILDNVNISTKSNPYTQKIGNNKSWDSINGQEQIKKDVMK
jgi:hypothetical protein